MGMWPQWPSQHTSFEDSVTFYTVLVLIRYLIIQLIALQSECGWRRGDWYWKLARTFDPPQEVNRKESLS